MSGLFELSIIEVLRQILKSRNTQPLQEEIFTHLYTNSHKQMLYGNYDQSRAVPQQKSTQWQNP